jgi:hypothetical protein
MSPTPQPRRGPVQPAVAVAPTAVPPGWSAAHPVDDGDPATEPFPVAAGPPGRQRAAAAAPTGRPVTTRPPQVKPAPAPSTGLGAPRTATTGTPRVDWAAYDAQVYDRPPEWVLYRCWTRVPIDGRWWVRWRERAIAFVLGRRHRLLWIGISMRAGIARATEHLADKEWRRLIHVFEIDPDAGDAGEAGARYFTTEAAAELYEDGRIAAECPRFNRRGNDRAYNPGAVHLERRFHNRHRADQRHQAGQLALAWFALTVLFAFLLYPDAGEPGFTAAAGRFFTAVLHGVCAGAVAMTFGRIIRLAVRGEQPTTGQKARLAARAGSPNRPPARPTTRR